MIYIREAHPKDGWWLGDGPIGLMSISSTSKAATDVYDPKTIEERRAVAGQCEEIMKYGIRTYVDEMDDKVSEAYAAKPTRLYLIGVDGRVEYAGGLGPHGFKPKDLREAIEEYISKEDRAASNLMVER